MTDGSLNLKAKLNGNAICEQVIEKHDSSDDCVVQQKFGLYCRLNALLGSPRSPYEALSVFSVTSMR